LLLEYIQLKQLLDCFQLKQLRNNVQLKQLLDYINPKLLLEYPLDYSLLLLLNARPAGWVSLSEHTLRAVIFYIDKMIFCY